MIIIQLANAMTLTRKFSHGFLTRILSSTGLVETAEKSQVSQSQNHGFRPGHAMSLDKGASHRESLAKYAAIFRISRSI
jgi:ribosomal protein L34